jgi:hypothetical protein
VSVLDFLTSVFGNLITVFSTLWGNVYFIISTAYSTIYNYWVRLQYFLQVFSNTYVFSTDHYHYRARNPTDQLDVFHFAENWYSSVQTISQTVEYNQTFRNPLADFVYNMQGAVRNIVYNFYGAIQNLASKPQHVINYMLGLGYNVTTAYEQFERPTLRFLIPRSDKIGVETDEPFFSHILHIGQNLFSPIADVFGPKLASLQELIGSAAKVARVTSDKILPKIEDVFTSRYTGLVGMLDIASNVIDLFSPSKRTKLDYLLDEGVEWLVTVTSQPKQSILGMIEDIFFSWFLERLFLWLTEQVSE